MTFSTKALLVLSSMVVATTLLYRRGLKKRAEESRARRLARRDQVAKTG